VALSLSQVLADPDAAAQHLQAANHLWHCTVLVAAPSSVTLRLVLRPNPPFDSHGYPVECAWLALHADGLIAAILPDGGAGRRWKHRYPGTFSMWPPHRRGHGTLCLHYPEDPQVLKVSWADGLARIVMVVHRHLLFEEWWRRTGRWPVEDAPHGPAPRGRHPITDPTTRQLVRKLS
jgi:hypothetical protein